jgi:transcriptional regulator with XRE-family HTH domain
MSNITSKKKSKIQTIINSTQNTKKITLVQPVPEFVEIKIEDVKNIDSIESNINHGIAKKIKLLRVLNSMSQSKLAKELGVSFQQVQKYENGLSNLTVAKLCIIAKIFGTSVNFFFDENNEFLNNIPTQAKNISAVMEDIEMISGYFKKKNN